MINKNRTPVKETKAGKKGKSPDSKKQRVRRKKDSNAPKRAMSAFMFFSNDIRETVKKERPDLAFLEIATEIGARWQATPEPKRKKYQLMAEKDKKRYLEQKSDYVPDPAFLKAGRKKKDPYAPKRSLSAYLYYCNDFREAVKTKNPGVKITQIATILATHWKALPEKKRGKYNKLAEDDKARYQAEMAVYNANRGP